MFWDTFRGLPTTLPDRHNNRRCGYFCGWFAMNKMIMFVFSKLVLCLWLYRNVVVKRFILGVLVVSLRDGGYSGFCM